MYAKGMTTRDIESHVKEIYFCLEISPTAISSITEKILDHAKEWQSRPLNELYPVVVNSWKNNWPTLSTYFKYSLPIRKIIYTTNIVENLHRQMRKVTKNRTVSPTDDSLFKLLYLAVKDVTVKWTTPKWNWGQVIAQLSIHFEDRVELDLM